MVTMKGGGGGTVGFRDTENPKNTKSITQSRAGTIEAEPIAWTHCP